MTWIYEQSTGALSINGKHVGDGYSGHGEGVNNPALEAVADVGPIPQGRYTIGPSFQHPAAGPLVMRLRPYEGTDTHGRDAFMVHGDTPSLDHTASHGCIIMPRTVRAAMACSNDRELEVVP